jgi:hypothetical protein
MPPPAWSAAVTCANRWLRRLILAVLAIAAIAAASLPAAAQPCSSDAQCRDFGRTRTTCSGNTLITKQSICAGTCRTVEISRIPCPGACVADRCVGGSLRSEPARPPLGGGGLVAGVCGSICTCKGKTLTYGVGFARRADQCQRRTVDCVYGCSCDPEPRCLKRSER